jgi:LmbE family N-acetylglucosaminyl deacetylase
MKQVLVCAAHPDDEVLGCGGTIARHVADGDRVSVLWMTDGVGSRFYGADRLSHGDDWDKACVARNNAALRATEILGVQDCGRLWDRSSGLAYALEDQRLDISGVAACAKAIEDADVKPQIIYTHHLGDLNADHRITAQAVLTAFRPVPGSSVEAIYAFEVPSSTEWGLSPFVPDTFIDVTGMYFGKKVQALGAYETEMREWPHPRSFRAIEALAQWRGASAGIQYAESFQTLRRVIR